MVPSAPEALGDLAALLADAGIGMVEERVVASPEEAAEMLDGPVVLKLSAPGLAHKTELGGVETGLENAPRVALVLSHVDNTPDVASARLVVNDMLVETVKGYTSHEQDTLEKVIQARNQAASAGESSRGARPK